MRKNLKKSKPQRLARIQGWESPIVWEKWTYQVVNKHTDFDEWLKVAWASFSEQKLEIRLIIFKQVLPRLDPALLTNASDLATIATIKSASQKNPQLIEILLTCWATARADFIQFLQEEIERQLDIAFLPEGERNLEEGYREPNLLAETLQKHDSFQQSFFRAVQKQRIQHHKSDYDLALLWLSSAAVPGAKMLAKINGHANSSSSLLNIPRVRSAKGRTPAGQNANKESDSATSSEILEPEPATESQQETNVPAPTDSTTQGTALSNAQASGEAVIEKQRNENPPQQEEQETQPLAEQISSIQEQIDLHQALCSQCAEMANALAKTVFTISSSELRQNVASLSSLAEGVIERLNAIEESLSRCAKQIWIMAQQRPGLDLALPPLQSSTDAQQPAAEDSYEQFAQLQSASHAITQYDIDRQNSQKKIENLATDLTKLHAQLSAWTDETTESSVFVNQGTDSLKQMTLAELSSQQQRLETELKQARTLLQEAKERHFTEISLQLQKLQDLDVPSSQQINAQFRMSDLLAGQYRDCSVEEIISLQNTLAELADRQLLFQQSSTVAYLADSLRQSWTDQTLLDLLSRLIAQKNNEEALLLLLLANTQYSPQSPLILSSDTFEGLLQGMAQIAGDEGLLEFLSGIAESLFMPCSITDQRGSVALHIALLVTHLYSEHGISPSLLWHIGTDWPVDYMPNWQQLWQNALLDTPFEILTEAVQQEHEAALADAQQQAEEALQNENGVYLRSRNLKSNRHIHLLNQQLLPGLSKHLDSLLALLHRIKSTTLEQQPPLLAQIRDTVVSIRAALTEEQLEATYQRGIQQVGIKDTDPFHHRTAFKVYEETGQALDRFADTVLGYCQFLLNHHASLSAADLIQELLLIYPDSIPLFLPVQPLLFATESPTKTGNYQLARQQSILMLEERLLTQSTYAQRLPRIVGFLAANLTDDQKLLNLLLDDLAHPLQTPNEAAQHLLQCMATKQALSLLEQIASPLQKQAKTANTQQEQEVRGLQTEMLRLGGNPNTAEHHMQLGRWELARHEIKEQIRIQNELTQQAQQQTEREVRGLLRLTQEIEWSLYDHQADIPPYQYRRIEEGFALARRFKHDPSLFQPVHDFLKEVEYRIEHAAWTMAEVDSLVDNLDRYLQSKVHQQSDTRSSAELLQIFEQGDLSPLGIGKIETSSIESRHSFLHNWQALLKMPGLMSEDLDLPQRQTIQHLYSDFMRIMALTYMRSPSGDPIIGEKPVVYTLCNLKYPRSDVLNRPCILLALPGGAPSPSTLTELDEIIDHHQWLDDSFILLFVPGCTERQRRRIESTYRNRRLVLIDDQVINGMLTAEADSKKPLGRLRAAMLNSAGATFAIFRTQQSVSQRTGIFVGRQNWIDRIINTGDCYALYGGRRIGKSSIMMEVMEQLKDRRDYRVIRHSFDAEKDASDDATAVRLGRLMELKVPTPTPSDFKLVMQQYMMEEANLTVIILLDEIDRYITANDNRHLMIEALRSLSDLFGDRFRVTVAGFMPLHDCLVGGGPDVSTSSPWRRLFTKQGPVPNLSASQAEEIVREGFLDILDWKFESPLVPLEIVKKTGQHPAFVQSFCDKLQDRVSRRGDRTVRMQDINDVFDDPHPEHSFMAHVRDTLAMNLKDPAHFLILHLANDLGEHRRFSYQQMKQYADLCRIPIPQHHLEISLQSLVVNSVVNEVMQYQYEFTVPDYPSILVQLGETRHLNQLEDRVCRMLEEEARLV